MAHNTVKFTWNKQALNNMSQYMKEGMFALGFDIAAQARRNAPVETSALRNSIRVVPDGSEVHVKAGGVVAQSSRGAKNVNYAYYREVMPNKKNPNSVHYMRNAMRTIMSGDYMKKYFGKVAK